MFLRVSTLSLKEKKMNTKICKSCGQANSAEATVCQKCYLNLQPNDSFNSGGQTANQNAASEPKSNKMYWIIGGIGAVVIIGGFFIVALAVGIYYYTDSDEDKLAKNTNTESNANIKTIADSNGNTGEDIANINLRASTNKDVEEETKTENLKEYIETKYPLIGDFKMITVSEMKERNKKIFPQSKDEAFAIYSSNKDNPLEILFSIANYRKVSEAVTDVKAFRKKILKDGKILKESNLSDGVIITYKSKSLIGILDCKDKLCADVSGIDGNKVADFYKRIRAK